MVVVVYVMMNARRFWPTPNITSSTSPNCSTQPSFVGEVGMEREGENGLAVWFSLEDNGNNDTCTSGFVDIRIVGGIEDLETGQILYPSLTPIYSTSWQLRPTDFATWKFTNSLTGASSAKLIWHSRRIPYEDLRLAPGMAPGYVAGQAEVVVRPDDGGPQLTGKSHEPLYFYK
ncbi:MAG: hypothetical protein WA005_03620 [Candidatus Binataceae bacterium]